MIPRIDLRRLMELQGYDAETIEQTLAKFEGLNLVMEDTAAAIDLLRDRVREMAEAWEDFMQEYADEAQPLQRPAKLLRPPRCIGPKNKAATRAQRPARVARSSCRKIRR